MPTLYTALSLNSTYDVNPIVYSETNPFIIKSGEVVEIVVNNINGNLHPWHTHGHSFQVIERTLPKQNGGIWPGTYYTLNNYTANPVVRDTIMIQNKGWTVIRFKADNPDKYSPYSRSHSS